MLSNRIKLQKCSLVLVSIFIYSTVEAGPTAIQSAMHPSSAAPNLNSATTIDPVLEFAHRRVQDIKSLIGGPNGRPAPVIAAYQSCQQLYERRLQLLPKTLDYKPAYWDDPRNQVAVFLGTMFAPAFYFLSYTGISSYLDAARQIDPRIELDALRHVSAQQRCFVN